MAPCVVTATIITDGTGTGATEPNAAAWNPMPHHGSFLLFHWHLGASFLTPPIPNPGALGDGFADSRACAKGAAILNES